MTYQEKVDYLIQTEKQFEGKEMYDGIKRIYQIIKGEVYDFELNVFNILYNSIMNEKSQIDFLNEQKENHKNDELFNEYLDKEIERHKNNIKMFGEQVYSLYSREMIIGNFEKRKDACQKRIDYCNMQLNMNSQDPASTVAVRYETNYMNQINNALSILNGTMIEMVDSYLNVSEIGHRL